MRKNYFLFLFLLVLLADLLAIYSGDQTLQFIFKPLILGSLIIYFLVNFLNKTVPFRQWMMGALLFSLAGDILLMFDSRPGFFLWGLSAFLLAHVFYIILFYSIIKKESLPLNARLFIPVAVYYGALVSLLFPVLGEMRIPVLVYGLIISTMFVLALHMPGLKQKEAGIWMAAGAAFFVLSDSLLAFNKFYRPFSLAGLSIILTYACAQYAIVTGISRYLNEKLRIRI